MMIIAVVDLSEPSSRTVDLSLSQTNTTQSWCC